MHQQIIDCKRENPDWGYKKIAKAVGCTYSNVRHHLSLIAREQGRVRKARHFTTLNGILKRKKDNFQFIDGSRKIGNRNGRKPSTFTALQLKDKLTTSPTCYLTGRKINLLCSRSYHLDHIVPVSKGGNNTLENCGLTCRDANIAKSNLDVNSFLSLCKEVLEHNGYEVKLAESRELASQTV